PIAFLMALIPAFSYNAYRLLGKLVFCFLMKVAITMLIVVAFGVASLIQNALGAEAGYVMIMIINTALIIAIWVKRSEIFNVITSPSSANLNSTLG
ncbi:hypothetical protein R0J90_15075, partial [Micrococcus sp. SIMBA_144]